MVAGPLQLALDVADRFDRLGIPYVLGGSVASSFLGEPRTTIDVDVAVRMTANNLEAVVGEVEADFYIPLGAAAEAISNASAFNLIHLETGLKVDIFVLGTGILDTLQMQRRQRFVVQREPLVGLWVTSAEDQILRKLEWHKVCGRVSDRQWRDILGLLVTQRDYLDFVYLAEVARHVALSDDLAQAQRDANDQ